MSDVEAILDLALLPAQRIPQGARQMARFSLYDWLVCGLAGVGEPLSAKLRDLAASEGGRPVASVFGAPATAARTAALVNGATSHALDYDDTHFGHIGHPSVAIYSAALAAGEVADAPAGAVADAFLLGAEASVRIGMVLGAAHYNRGFHQTATAGAFGATIAAGRLLGLSCDQLRVALGLCATRASGLKSQFGTMGKPYNAGIAASNGVECAELARRGFTSADDGIFGAQGFVPTHSDATGSGMWDWPPPGVFLFEDIKYKLHACCHGTHAMIEALKALPEAIEPDAVQVFRLSTNPRWLSVCDIKRPRTGLEVKFSYNWLAGMVLHGIGTADDRVYTDALAADARLGSFAERVTVTGDGGLTDMQAVGVLHLADGRSIEVRHDLALRLPAKVLERSLRGKAQSLIGGRAEALWSAVSGLDGVAAKSLGALIGDDR